MLCKFELIRREFTLRCSVLLTSPKIELVQLAEAPVHDLTRGECKARGDSHGHDAGLDVRNGAHVPLEFLNCALAPHRVSSSFHIEEGYDRHSRAVRSGANRRIDDQL